MEKATVTFDNGEKTIVIDLSYNKESSDLEYKVTLDESYNENDPMDFIGFLSSMFLNTLIAE